MKKTFLIISVAVLLLSSCSLFSKKEEVPQAGPVEIQNEKKLGLITTAKEQNLLVDGDQFVLLTDSGEKIFINSISVNLKKYKKRRVEIDGRFSGDKNVFNVENIASIGNEMQVKQSYMNSSMGIKFNYPSIWVLQEQKNVFGLRKILITPYELNENESNSIDNIAIELSENNKKLSSREWLNLNDKYEPTDAFDKNNIYQQSFIGVGQLSAVKKTSGTSDKVEFFINRDAFIYRFAYFTINDADKDIYRNAFYDLVGSFEFIPFGTSPSGEISSKKETNSTEPTKSLSELAAEKKLEIEKAKEVQKKAEEESLKVQLESQKAEAQANAKQIFADYIKKNISSFAKEPASLGGTWFVQSIEFAYLEGHPDEFNAIYVVYEDGHDLRKILLSVLDRTKPETMEVGAYFKPGDTTDWTLSEGTDTAKGNEKFIVKIANGEIETVVKKGMQILDAKNFKIHLQYPSSWYWAYINDSYMFSNKSVTADNVLLKLTKDSAPVAQDFIKECKELEIGKFCLTGGKDYEETINQMMETLQK